MPHNEHLVYIGKDEAFYYIFAFYDSANHLVPKTGVTGITVQWRNRVAGPASWTTSATAVVTEWSDGLYRVQISNNDGSPGQWELGAVIVKITGTGADTVFIQVERGYFTVINPYNFGMTALPNVTPGNLGAVLTSGTTQHTVQTDAAGFTACFANADKFDYNLSVTGYSTIASYVWGAVMSGFVTAGTFGKKIQDILSDVWAIPLPGGYTSGTAGQRIGANLDAAISSRSSLTGTDVETSVLAALDDANVEPGSVPTSTSGLRQMIQFIFAYFRNKRSASSSVETLYKEDGTTPHGTAPITEAAGTVTKGEMS